MKLIAISAITARQLHATVAALLAELLAAPDDCMLLIDSNSIKRYGDQRSAREPISAHRVELSDWLKPGTDGYVPDQAAIRASAAILAPDLPVILDAGGYQLSTILPILNECRSAWFELERWHPAFVLLCNDVVLPYAAEELFDTFYSRPNLLTQTEVTRLVKGMRRRARLSFWFGLGPSTYKRIASRIWAWIDDKTSRAETRDFNEVGRWTPR